MLNSKELVRTNVLLDKDLIKSIVDKKSVGRRENIITKGVFPLSRLFLLLKEE